MFNLGKKEDRTAELQKSQEPEAKNAELATQCGEDCANAKGRIAELEAENEVLNNVNKELTLKIEELSNPKTIAEAGNRAAEKRTPAMPVEQFEVGGNAYKFVCPVFMFKKNRVVAAEAIHNESLLAELVAAKVGAISLVK